jgi:hypothetical protein
MQAPGQLNSLVPLRVRDPQVRETGYRVPTCCACVMAVCFLLGTMFAALHASNRYGRFWFQCCGCRAGTVLLRCAHALVLQQLRMRHQI